jgi:hypothetical protein
MLWQEWSQQCLNAVGKLVADIIVENLWAQKVEGMLDTRNRNGAPFGSRRFAQPWTGRPGNDEGEFSLAGASSCSVKARS